MEENLGMRVDIVNKNNSGRLTINYKNLEQFELISNFLSSVSQITNINNQFFNMIFLSSNVLDLIFSSTS